MKAAKRASNVPSALKFPSRAERLRMNDLGALWPESPPACFAGLGFGIFQESASVGCFHAALFQSVVIPPHSQSSWLDIALLGTGPATFSQTVTQNILPANQAFGHNFLAFPVYIYDLDTSIV